MSDQAPKGPQEAESTSVETQLPNPNNQVSTYEPGTGDLMIEDATIQGASFLVERITPVPPSRDALKAMEPRDQGSNKGAPVISDEPTAAVQNPGSRPPAQPQAPGKQGAGPLKVDPTSVPAMSAGMSPMTKPAGEGVPYVETAYVPLPAPPGAAPPAGASPQATIVGLGIVPPKKNLKQMVEQIMASKNARLGIIAAAGIFGIGIVFVVLGPKQTRDVPQQPAITAVPEPERTQKPPPQEEPPKTTDPAKIEEKDILLEKAILAVEGGRTDEALNLFRRYTEEEQNPAADFMVQLLNMQLAQTGKEQ